MHWVQNGMHPTPRAPERPVVLVGCFADRFYPRAMTRESLDAFYASLFTTLVPGVQGYAACKEHALREGYKYFALQNAGKECYVTNDATASKGPGQYGRSKSCGPLAREPAQEWLGRGGADGGGPDHVLYLEWGAI